MAQFKTVETIGLQRSTAKPTLVARDFHLLHVFSRTFRPQASFPP